MSGIEWHPNYSTNNDTMIHNMRMMEQSYTYNPPAPTPAYIMVSSLNRPYENVLYNMSQSYSDNTGQPDLEIIAEVNQSLPVHPPVEQLHQRQTVEEPRISWLHPRSCYDLYHSLLTPYERNEIFSHSRIYYVGQNVGRKAQGRKIPGTFSIESNFGYDDAEGGYNVVLNDHIGYRYEILRVLGKGSFGQVLKVYDHKTKQLAALKIVRNDERFLQFAQTEVKILEQLLREDPANTANVVHIQNNFIFRNHACIVFELMSINLFEVNKKNNFRGFSLKLVRSFAHSLTIALSVLKRNQIIHGDLKPENIMIKKFGKSGLKVIDFGSSCYAESSRLLTYVQSRFYRAPEVILGCPIGVEIDMWSLGCILAELMLGCPLLAGHNEDDQMALMVEMLGVPPPSLREISSKWSRFFSVSNVPHYLMTRYTSLELSRGPPHSRPLIMVLENLAREEEHRHMVSFISKCLTWEPWRRLTPEQALSHPWLRSNRRSYRH